MAYMPGEIVSNILNRLPADPDLLRLRTVCKEWRSIIDDPVFAKLNHVDMLVIKTNVTRFYSMPLGSLTTSKTATRKIQVNNINNNAVPPSASVAFSSNCHGFLLITLPSREFWVLWNPFTKERLEFPPPDNDDIHLSGVGYDVATNDYKVVVINRITDSKIYSMKSGAWRGLPSCNIIPWTCQNNNHYVVFASGALHWLAFVHGVEVVFSLDLSSETVQILDLPICHSYEHLHHYHRLRAFGGCLHFSCNGPENRLNNTHGWSLWNLQDYKGGKGEWNKLMSVPFHIGYGCITAVAYLKSKEQVVVRSDKKLMWFDVKSNKCVKMIAIKGVKGYFWCHVIPVSLDWRTRTRGDGQSIGDCDDALELELEMIVETSYDPFICN